MTEIFEGERWFESNVVSLGQTHDLCEEKLYSELFVATQKSRILGLKYFYFIMKPMHL